MNPLTLRLLCCSTVLLSSVSAIADLGQLGSVERQQYEKAYAQGRYRELAEAIETKASGWFPQEFFFAGAANFGLAGRAGASSVRCAHVERARDFLEQFLLDANEGYRRIGHFGTVEDLNYVRTGVKMLEALKTFRGCEEQGYSADRLRRFAVRYGRQRVRGVFFGTETGTAADRVHAILETEVFDRIRSLVDRAARIEARYGMISTEFEAGRDRFGGLVTRINALGQNLGAGSSAPNLIEIDPVKGVVSVRQDVVSSVVATVRVGRHEAWTAVNMLRTNVLDVLGVNDPVAYVDKKTRTIEQFELLNARVLGQAVVWKELKNGNRSGLNTFEDALKTPAAGTLADLVANVDATWRDAFKAECSVEGSFWFCTG